ncbi:hypothetical protein [Kitasatospora brasiliensis]|nr:hypothetical protein [Kitasatospora sp. K002]
MNVELTSARPVGTVSAAHIEMRLRAATPGNADALLRAVLRQAAGRLSA